jgi:hypothetical protein
MDQYKITLSRRQERKMGCRAQNATVARPAHRVGPSRWRWRKGRGARASQRKNQDWTHNVGRERRVYRNKNAAKGAWRLGAQWVWRRTLERRKLRWEKRGCRLEGAMSRGKQMQAAQKHGVGVSTSGTTISWPANVPSEPRQ